MSRLKLFSSLIAGTLAIAFLSAIDTTLFIDLTSRPGDPSRMESMITLGIMSMFIAFPGIFITAALSCLLFTGMKPAGKFFATFGASLVFGAYGMMLWPICLQTIFFGTLWFMYLTRKGNV